MASKPESVVDKPDSTGFSSSDYDQDAAFQSESKEELQYPTRLNLATIVFALCLAVFCVALDNTVSGCHQAPDKHLRINTTYRSSPRPSRVRRSHRHVPSPAVANKHCQESPTTSNGWKMPAGTAVPIL